LAVFNCGSGVMVKGFLKPMLNELNFNIYNF